MFLGGHDAENYNYISAQFIFEIFIFLPLIIGYILTSIYFGFYFLGFGMGLVSVPITINWFNRGGQIDANFLWYTLCAFSFFLLLAFIVSLL